MGKFDDLEKNLSKITNNAALQNSNPTNTKNILIYNVPKQWTKILKQNGMSFSSYAKIAILEKMKRDKLI